MGKRIIYSTVIILVMVFLTYNTEGNPQLEMCHHPVKNQTCILQCIVQNRTSSVTFKHPPGTSQGICLGNGSQCYSTNYTITQNGSITSIYIGNLDKNRDEGGWACLHGSITSQNKKLTVSTPLGIGIQIKPEVTVTDSEITITCEMPCQYPTANVTVEVIFTEEGQEKFTTIPAVPKKVPDFSNKTGCDIYESNYKMEIIYPKSVFTPTMSKNLMFKCNFTHSILQTTTGDTGPAYALIEVSPDNRLKAGAIAGIVIGLLILVVLVFGLLRYQKRLRNLCRTYYHSVNN